MCPRSLLLAQYQLALSKTARGPCFWGYTSEGSECAHVVFSFCFSVPPSPLLSQDFSSVGETPSSRSMGDGCLFIPSSASSRLTAINTFLVLFSLYFLTIELYILPTPQLFKFFHSLYQYDTTTIENLIVLLCCRHMHHHHHHNHEGL